MLFYACDLRYFDVVLCPPSSRQILATPLLQNSVEPATRRVCRQAERRTRRRVSSSRLCWRTTSLSATSTPTVPAATTHSDYNDNNCYYYNRQLRRLRRRPAAGLNDNDVIMTSAVTSPMTLPRSPPPPLTSPLASDVSSLPV